MTRDYFLQFARSMSAQNAKRKAAADHDRWTAYASDLINATDRFDFELEHSAGYEFQLQFLHAEGQIVFLVRKGDSKELVLFRWKSVDGELVGCSCKQCSTEEPCSHALAALDYLNTTLYSSRSELSRRIAQQKFDQGKIDDLQFLRDAHRITLNAVDALASSLVATPMGLSQLPPVSEKSIQERLVWDIGTASNRSLSIFPLVQQAKKGGKGFRKGKSHPIRLVLSDYYHLLSESDRRALKRFSPSTSHCLDSPLFVISDLVGAPNVELEGKPVDIVTDMVVIKPVETREGWKLKATCSNSMSSIGVVFGARDMLVFIGEESARVSVAKIPQEWLAIVNKLLALPAVPNKHKEEFFSSLLKLQEKLPCLLVEGTEAELKPAPIQYAMLLRSTASGSLDYGLRVKLPSGLTMLPGEGSVVEFAIDNGKRVQFIRNAESEQSRARAICEMLGLEPNGPLPYTDSITSFEAALGLLEKLEQNRDSVGVLWDDQSKAIHRVVGELNASQLRVEVSSKRNWFGVGGACNVGGEEIPLTQLLAKLDGTSSPTLGGFVQVKEGQWLRIEDTLRKKLERIRAVCHTDRKSLVMDATAAAAFSDLANLDIEFKATQAWQKCMSRLAAARSFEPVVPNTLNADLRDYQVEGFKWMRRLAEWGVGGVLADDMGLGKTLQTIAVLIERAEEGPALVLAPTSVGFNWIRELQRFAPHLNPRLYRESDRKELLAALGPGDVVVSSYAIALRDASELSDREWGTLVLDEAHALKNARTKTSQSVSQLNAKWTIGLTGTPVENHLGELWSLFSVVAPGVFGGWESFRSKFAGPIEKSGDPVAKEMLAERLKPFVLRRTKKNVLKELPARTESVLTVELSPAERSQYELVRRAAIGELQSIVTLPDQKDQRFKILALLTRLRQFACHPKIVNKNWDRSSAKLDQLIETLLSLREEGHRTLVFSQFTEHLGLIREALDSNGISYEYLDGSTPAAQRQKCVDAFQNGNATAFLISLKAGGTGLNLTAADYVIHMDPWWNPAVEDQATDRAHRFGQTKPVMVYRIVAKDTIEEEILALHETKRDLVQSVLAGAGEASKFSTSDLIAMIRAE